MKCSRCNHHTGTFDPPHSCIYDERDQLLKKVADLETELEKLGSDKASNDRDYLELTVRHSALENEVSALNDILEEITECCEYWMKLYRKLAEKHDEPMVGVIDDL